MKRLQFGLITISLAVAMSAGASIVVNFDSLSTPNTGSGSDWGTVPSSYAGLAWTGWEVTKADGSAGSYQAVYNNTYGAPSGPNFAYNGGNGYMTISTSGSEFNFDGAEVTSFVQNDTYQSFSSKSLTINAYNGASLVGTWTGSLSATAFVALPAAAQFQNITSLEFISTGTGKYWGLDNFAYTPVPEASTTIAGMLLLLPLGASTLRILRKHRAA